VDSRREGLSETVVGNPQQLTIYYLLLLLIPAKEGRICETDFRFTIQPRRHKDTKKQ